MIRKVMINAGLFKITRPIETKPVDPEPLEAELDFTSSEEEKEIIPTPSPTVPVTPETPLAYCDKCKAWHPMKWLPQAERGKRAEEWFMCAVCGGRSLTLRYLSPGEALAKNLREKMAREGGKHA